MIALYQAAMALLFILASFVRLPFFLPGRGLADMNALFVLYLAYFRPVRQGAAFVCAVGIAMDSLSAGPFGLHLVVYLFLFTVFRLAPRYLQVKNALFLAASSALAVLVEEGALAFPVLAAGAEPAAPPELARHIFMSVLFAGVVGWPVISALRAGSEKVSAWRTARRTTA
ncbi:MAG: hypothetical protein AB1921_14630 [Thermodesulfobacteriota bacterium]